MSPIGNSLLKKHRRVMLIQAWWRDGIMRGVGRYAREHDWILDCHMRWNQRLNEKEKFEGEGFIVYAGEEVTNVPNIIQYVKSTGLPVVDLGCYSKHFNNIRVVGDDFERGGVAAKYLISLGFRNLAFVRNEFGMAQRRREEGFMQAAANHSLRPTVLMYSDLAQTISSLARPLGISSANDHTAISTIITCLDLGIHVPEEVAIVGMDDTDVICDLSPIPLSSVNFNDESIGYRAAETLDHLISFGKIDNEVTVVPCRGVTVRASSDTLAIADISAAKALRFIRTEYRRPVKIKDIATNAASLRWIQKQFHRYTGKTMIEELVGLRLNHAKKLLATTSLKVESVGYESGFSNRSHFVTTFKKFTGLTPSAYRTSSKRDVCDDGSLRSDLV